MWVVLVVSLGVPRKKPHQKKCPSKNHSKKAPKQQTQMLVFPLVSSGFPLKPLLPGLSSDPPLEVTNFQRVKGKLPLNPSLRSQGAGRLGATKKTGTPKRPTHFGLTQKDNLKSPSGSVLFGAPFFWWSFQGTPNETKRQIQHAQANRPQAKAIHASSSLQGLTTPSSPDSSRGGRARQRLRHRGSAGGSGRCGRWPNSKNRVINPKMGCPGWKHGPNLRQTPLRSFNFEPHPCAKLAPW